MNYADRFDTPAESTQDREMEAPLLALLCIAGVVWLSRLWTAGREAYHALFVQPADPWDIYDE